MNNKKPKIILAGGGTAGHIFPLIEIFKELRGEKDLVFSFFGTGSEAEKRIVKEYRISYQKILSGKFRRYIGVKSFFQNIGDLFLFKIGVIQAIFLFLGDRPKLIFSKGGYGSLPTVLAGAFLKIPIIIHESDILPGLANRIASKYARRIAVAFPVDSYPLSIKRKAFFSGLPLGQGFNSDNNAKEGNYILIFGGSQGAQSLNNLVFKNLNHLLKIAPVVHLTGEGDFGKAKQIKANLDKSVLEKYEAFSFRQDMADLISGAKLVVCRAGANSIFEIAALGKRAVFVPIPGSVTEHQIINATYLKAKEMAEVFFHSEDEKDFIKTIDKAYRQDKNEKIGELYFPWSKQIIASAILNEIKSVNFLERISKVFFIGINGVSMRGIASIVEHMGKKVIGSDLKTGGHSAKNITRDIDLVVYSSAASINSAAKEEHEQASKYNLPILKRSEMIGKLLQGKSAISVSGMHGKTTTSAIISRVLMQSGFKPSYLIGAPSSPFVPTANFSKEEYFVVEACEYDGSFLDFDSTIGLINNIEEEHLDFFKGGIEEIIMTFEKFVKKIKYGGLLIYNFDDKNCQKVVSNCKSDLQRRCIKTLSYGFKEGADIEIYGYGASEGKTYFSFKKGGKKLKIEPKTAGRHFAYNSAAAFAVSSYLGIDEGIFKASLESFPGAKGRFEYFGEKKGVPVYYDYGHHPTELKSVFDATDDLYPDKRKFFIFQFHQQDRFNHFFEAFFDVISKSSIEVAGILPVYAVPGRDAAPKFTSRDLVDRLSENGKKAFLLDSYDESVQFLSKNCRKGDMVVVIGATEVWRVAENFLKK